MVNRSACPVCTTHGSDKSGNNLVDFGNGTKHCFACNYHEGTQIESGPVNSTTLYMPPSAQVLGVCYDTAAFFGVTSDGYATFFHYFDETGKLIGVKSRNYTAECSGAHKHETIRYAGESTLYGLNTLQHTDTLVLVEGESDTLFTWQALDGTTDVLGLPGASTAKYVTNLLDTVSTYTRIVVITDNDAAGNKLRDELYRLLPEWLIHEAYYPAHAKDSRDCTAQELIECVNNATLHSTETRVVTGKHAHEAAVTRNFINTRPLLDMRTLSPGLHRLLANGFHAGDFIGLLGNSGKGKSTLLYQIAAHALLNSVNTLFVTNEASADYTCSRLAAFCGTDVLGERCTVVETYSFDALLALLKTYASEMVFIDVLNSIAPNFIDPALTSSYMRQLLSYVNKSGVCVLTSIHTTATNEQFKPMPLRLSDAAGGRAVQRSLNGVLSFTAGLQNMHETSRYVTLSKPLRNRHVHDTTGVVLQYDEQRGIYFEYGAYNGQR